MLFSNKQKRKRMTREEADAIIERSKKEAPLELEKGDLKAMFIAAIIVFLPFILFFAGTMGLLWWLIFRVWGG